MKYRCFMALFFMVLLNGCIASPFDKSTHFPPLTQQSKHQIPALKIDGVTSQKIDSMLKLQNPAGGGLSVAERISRASCEFMGTPYAANMLRGSATVPEQLVIDFRGLDCFTYLDYVAAMSQSDSREDFIENLVRTRYVDADVSFVHRRHFFTDWAYQRNPLARDVTCELGAKAMTVVKNLNQKADGSSYLPGLPVVKRKIVYIPAKNVDEKLVSKLKNGDYIGIYTGLAGLDVTHVGFFFMTDKGPMLRNASSKKANMKVVDSPFLEYVANTPGIVVLRDRRL